MSLYPTLEDMKVSQMQDAQGVPVPQYDSSAAASASPPGYDVSAYTFSHQPGGASASALYPTVDDYMGMSLQRYEPFAPPATMNTSQRQVVRAPVSSKNLVGIQRAAIKPGISEVVLCKDETNHVGLKVRDINKGVFIQFIAEDSPASMAGLRFGDQILSINDEIVAGYSADKVHKLIRSCGPNNIRMAVRDRPFERTVTLAKDSAGMAGFGFSNGRIKSIIKDSSAARNGMLTDHQLVEINGRNVIGLKDKKISELMEEGGDVVTVTIMPYEIYEHMIKKIGSLIKAMDHSEPSC